MGQGPHEIMSATPQEPVPDIIADVKRFRTKFGINYDGLPRALPADGSDPVGHMLEEVEEFRVNHVALQLALQAGRPEDVATHLEECLDALVDLVYVAVGRAELMGFVQETRAGVPSAFERAWARVHEANMAKERVSSAAASKRSTLNDVVKPPGWAAPRHADLVVPNVYTAGGQS